MGTGSARADKCRHCGKIACQGDCQKCPARKESRCQHYFLPTYEDGRWAWSCGPCEIKRNRGYDDVQGGRGDGEGMPEA